MVKCALPECSVEFEFNSMRPGRRYCEDKHRAIASARRLRARRKGNLIIDGDSGATVPARERVGPPAHLLWQGRKEEEAVPISRGTVLDTMPSVQEPEPAQIIESMKQADDVQLQLLAALISVSNYSISVEHMDAGTVQVVMTLYKKAEDDTGRKTCNQDE